MSDPVRAVTGKWYEPIDTEKFWGDLAPAPSKREWVGLTDEEMDKAMEYWSDKSRSSYGGADSASEEYVDMVSTWRYIEAKLKEKNS